MFVFSFTAKVAPTEDVLMSIQRLNVYELLLLVVCTEISYCCCVHA